MEPTRKKLERVLRGQPINLSKDRAAKLKIGGQEAFVWCDTYKGRLRLRVVLPDGGEVEHIKMKEDGE